VYGLDRMTVKLNRGGHPRHLTTGTTALAHLERRSWNKNFKHKVLAPRRVRSGELVIVIYSLLQSYHSQSRTRRGVVPVDVSCKPTHFIRRFVAHNEGIEVNDNACRRIHPSEYCLKEKRNRSVRERGCLIRHYQIRFQFP